MVLTGTWERGEGKVGKLGAMMTPMMIYHKRSESTSGPARFLVVYFDVLKLPSLAIGLAYLTVVRRRRADHENALLAFP